MNQLAKNKFLVVMGVVFLIGVAAFGVLVLPAWTDAGTKSKRISDSVVKIRKGLSDYPGAPNMEDWNEQAQKLKERYGKPLQDLLKFDRNLGEWFEEVDNESTYAFFMNKYDDEQKKLQGELQDKGVLLGSPQTGDDNKIVEAGLPGFNWLRAPDIQARSGEDERAVKEILQKRFNICRAIVNAVIAGVDKGQQVPGRERRLLDVTFLEKFKYTPPGRVGADPAERAFSIPIDHKRYAGFTGPGSGVFVEYTLPRNGEMTAEGEAAPVETGAALGRTITFGFAVAMEYTQVPELLRHLIQPGVEPELNLTIVGLNVFVPKPNPAVVKETVILKEGDSEEAILKAFEARSAACPPPQVHVYVTCQVMDFEPAAVPSFLKP